MKTSNQTSKVHLGSGARRSAAKHQDPDSAAEMAWTQLLDPEWIRSDTFLQVAVILQAAERTSDGINWMRLNNKQLYCVETVLSMSEDLRRGLTVEFEEIMQIIVSAMRDENGEYKFVQPFDGERLHLALGLVIGSFESINLYPKRQMPPVAPLAYH